MEEDNISDETNKSNKEFDPDLHIQSAIKQDTRRLIRDRIRDKNSPCPTKFYSTVKNMIELKIGAEDVEIDSEGLYPILWNLRGEDKDLVQKTEYRSGKILDLSLKVGKIFTHANINALNSRIISESEQSPIEGENKQKLLSFLPSDDLYMLNSLRSIWYSIRNTMYKKLKIGDSTFTPIRLKYADYPPILINKDILITKYQEKLYIMDYEQVMMIHDTITSRYLCYLVSELYSCTTFEHIPSTTILKKLYSWGDKLIEARGNDAYSIIKNIEPVCTGVYLDKYEPLDLSKRFFKEILSEARDDGYEEEIQELYKFLSEETRNPCEIFEIFGCYRHFGHPTVDEVKGCEKMKENTREDKPIDEEVCKLVCGAWNRYFIFNYINRHKRWPRCTTSLDEDSLLGRLILENITYVDEHTLNVPLEDWATITFQQEFEFDYYPDFTQLLSDKALSPTLMNWAKVYNRNLHNIEVSKDMTESRRVLLEILRRPNIDLRPICEKIQSGNIPDSWKIVGLHSKERELKISARLFAMMVLEMRLYFCVTETNISENILKYMPCQTMTWDETTLTKHLHSITQPSKDNRFVEATLSLDFKNWNNSWRHSSTIRIFRNLDNLLGTPNLISRTHEFFESSWYYLSSDLHPPEYACRPSSNKSTYEARIPMKKSFQESKTTWAGQEGGCEGLRQKGWTASQGAELLYAKFITGIDGTITGQGDNQVLVLKIPIRVAGVTSQEYIENYKEELEHDISTYINLLDYITNKMGKTIKLHESWVSLYLMNYGKEILVKGVFTTSVFKKICRAYLSVTETFPSSADRIASIHTATHSACLKNVDSLIPFMIAIIEICNMFQMDHINSINYPNGTKEVFDKEKTVLDMDFLVFVNIFPKDLGGFPIMAFYDYIYRGHPDPVTSMTTWLKHISETIPMAKKILEFFVSLETINPQVDYQMSIQDPPSLNFKRPMNGVNVIKNTLEKQLVRITKNKDLKMLLNCSDEKKKQELVDYLAETTPYSPRVLNTIFRNSPIGARLDFIATFIDMKTLKGMLGSHESFNLKRKLMGCDEGWIIWVLQMYKRIQRGSYKANFKRVMKILDKPGSEVTSLCTYQLAQFLRDTTWRKKIEHVTVPHPLEQTILIKCGKECDSNYQPEFVSYIYVPPSSPLIPGRPEFGVGIFSPYLGSSTKAKLSSRVINLPRTDRSLKAAQALYQTKNWICDDNTQLSQFLSNLIKTRTSLPEETLAASTGTTCGGTVTHRFQDVVTKHQTKHNTRPTFFSNIYFSSDHAGKFSTGLEDYTMHYQALFLSGQYLLLYGISYNILSNERANYHQHIDCVGCCNLIKESLFENHKTPPVVKPMTNCKVVFSNTPDIEGQISWKNVKCMKLVYPNLEMKNLSKCRSMCAAFILMGVAHNQTEFQVHTPYSAQSNFEVTSYLSIGGVLQIGVVPILKSFATLWFVENFRDILRLSIDMASDLRIVIRTLIVRNPRSLWVGIRSLILHPQIRESLLQETGFFPGSSEAFRGGASLDILLSSLIVDYCFDELQSENPFYIPIYSTAVGYPISRCLYTWVNQIALRGYLQSPHIALKCLSRLRKDQINSIVDGEFRMEKFFMLYAVSKDLFPKLPDIIVDSPFMVSGVGSEPFIKIREAAIYIPQKMKLNRIPKALPHLKLFWEQLQDIPEVVNSRIDLTIKKDEIFPVMKEIPSVEDKIVIERLSMYTEHKFKLTGTYSSSHYKFVNILNKYNLKNIESAVCIGDGDGGVSKLLITTNPIKKILFNTLVDISKFPAHRAVGYFPPELLPYKHLGIVDGVNSCITLGGDITEEVYLRDICDRVNTRTVDLVVSDIEASRSLTFIETLEIVNSLYRIIQLTHGNPFVIIKTYISDVNQVHVLINYFLCFSSSVDVYSPITSSNSSLEIFLCFRKEQNSTIRFSETTYPFWTNISEIECKKIKNDLLKNQDNHHLTKVCFPSPTLHLLNLFFISLGYSSSIPGALQQFTGEYVDHNMFIENPLRCLSQTYEMIGYLAIERMKAYGAVSANIKIPSHIIKRTYNMKSEHKDVEFLVSMMFNITILTSFVKTRHVPIELFIKGVTLKYENQILFTYTPTSHQWLRKFGRPWFKITGWIEAGGLGPEGVFLNY